MKIGIFAGTFDPIHNGHLSFASSALEQAQLDRVVIVAEKEPYRKKPHASWDHRQAMIERATEDIVQVDHDYQFASQLAHQHTLKDMLEVAKNHYGMDNEFWFLVGSDLFEHMHQWQDLIHESEYGGFVVALRKGHTPEWLSEKLNQLKTKGLNPHIITVTNQAPELNSTSIRDELSRKIKTLHALPAVQDYVQQHELYLD